MIIIIYTVHTRGTDRDIGWPTHFFTNKDAATTFANGKGYYGGQAPVRTRKAIIVDEVAYLLDEIVTNPIRLDYIESKVDAKLNQFILGLNTEEIEALRKKLL